ncbi:HlyD family efflux transporter periplasmic adaptor subunit [Larkinella sp. VNQ87]|uniref:HlyD family efflux transporter periplasmic adaptor subunit n=1 Tax=Larkinella sp. VNQ87 TaxID=3400921 RepID=UPI003BFE0819
MNPGSDFIELRSEDVQELLTRPPGWLLRWGITVVLGVLGLLLAGSWVVHYPDLVRASFKLTSVNAPKAVVTRSEGKLVRLFAEEGKTVSSGAILAYLESTAQHEEVLRLSAQLRRAWQMARRGNLEALNRLDLENYHRLGELQTAFQTFEQTYIQLRAYLNDGFYSRKRRILEQELVDLKAMADNLNEQHRLQEKDMKLAQEDFEIQQKLAADKTIAPLELKREESKNLSRKMPYQQTASALISNLSAQRGKQKEILELDKLVTEQRDNFMQALNTLQSAVEAWKAKYVVVAPVEGQIYFPSVLQENQHVTTGQELLFIAPNTITYYGELRIPQQNFGKVKTGQAVLVKFAGYPFQEFGAVKGQIATIADVSLKDSVFLARVQLPSGLKTTYGQTLVYRTGMAASAEIMTEDSRLIEKLFYQLRKLSHGR